MGDRIIDAMILPILDRAERFENTMSRILFLCIIKALNDRQIGTAFEDGFFKEIRHRKGPPEEKRIHATTNTMIVSIKKFFCQVF